MSAAPPLAPLSPAEAPPRKGGCLRAGLIGCGVIVLLVVLCVVGFTLYARKNPGALLDFALSSIEKNYGPDVTEQDKTELRAAIEEFKEAIKSGRTRSDGNTGWQRGFTMRGGSGKLSHDDVQDLIRSFREAARPADGPASAPTMAPLAVPTPSS